VTALLKRLRAYLNRQRIKKLMVKRAEYMGAAQCLREGGLVNPAIEGRIAAIDELMRQLKENA